MLKVEDIEVRYQGASSAVRGVSLEVPDRSVVALLGSNGAGKTTILRAIGGLLRFHGGQVTRGAITFDGARIESRGANEIVRLGIAQALEGRRLFAGLTVDENLRAGALSSRDVSATRRAYERVMDLFPALRGRRQQMAGYLSGGEQQMLAIGRALMADPKLLLLDEPSLGLAPIIVRQIGDIISDISAGGISVLLVEQNARMALTHASAGYVLERGQVALSGPANELLRDEAVRAFYLGLHEGEGDANFGALRQRRPERTWTV
jgi:ABC-type branched-subunit amino acid transport system ATPase component